VLKATPKLLGSKTKVLVIPVADAIAAVSTRQQAKRVFNLYGQRLNKTQRGLNVIDGKALIAK